MFYFLNAWHSTKYQGQTSSLSIDKCKKLIYNRDNKYKGGRST